MSDLTREFSSHFAKHEGIDILEEFPGLCESPKFERFCEYLVEFDPNPDYLYRLVMAMVTIKKRLLDARTVKVQHEKEKELSSDKSKAIDLLKEAARLQGYREDFYIDLEKNRERRPCFEKYFDEASGKEKLRPIPSEEPRDVVDIDRFFYLPFYKFIDPGMPALVGQRGRASDNSSATIGLYVRLLHRALPNSFPNHYSFIAGMAKSAGLDVSRQKVRSLLLKGRT